MSPSTGRSGESQPGRRRRRGRRGSGGSGRSGRTGRNPADDGPSTASQPPSESPAAPTGRQNGSGGNPGDQPATEQPKRSRRRRRPRRTGRRTDQNADAQPSATGRAEPKARTGKAGKPGGRRLRTVDETSAGGLVVDADRASAALIGRLDRRGRLLWSLPKGHIEHGETPEQAAIREVSEETGIDGRVLAPLGTIDYWFVAEDRRVHKTVHHFLMEATGGELSDEDVEVTEVAWVPLGELDGRLAYADERRLVRLATEMLSESA